MITWRQIKNPTAMNKIIQHFLLGRRAVFAAGALALGGIFAGVLAAQTNSNAEVAIQRDPQPVHRGQLEHASFSEVVKRVSPSVVKITTQTKARQVRRGGNEVPGMDPMLREFFGGRVPPMPEARPQSGLGSGVVISADGYIATNNHVVDGADTVTVSFNDGREFTAKVIGRDPQTDLAVIKVDARNLPAVTFADTSKIEVGDRVLAIGNPFGIGETVTSGIISAKGRQVGILADVEGYEDFIQTDAAINPGNSGGALVDVEGRLIGINTAILSRTGGFQGVGLAVPANLVGQVTESLVKTGRVARGYLGIGIQNLTASLADSFKLKDNRGALVADVVKQGPADKAGLKEGDVVTSLDGLPVADANSLRMAVSSLAPGTKIELDVIRDGRKERLTAQTGERPKAGRMNRDEAVSSYSKDEGVLEGVAVNDIDANARMQLNLPARLQGAIITSVEPNSAAARAGLKVGDVILEINRQPVRSAEEAVALSASAESRKTLLRLWSRGGTIFVVVDETNAGKDAS